MLLALYLLFNVIAFAYILDQLGCNVPQDITICDSNGEIDKKSRRWAIFFGLIATNICVLSVLKLLGVKLIDYRLKTTN